jgi:hypothetical protein
MENVIGGKLKLKKPLEGAIKWVGMRIDFGLDLLLV